MALGAGAVGVRLQILRDVLALSLPGIAVGGVLASRVQPTEALRYE